MYYNGYPRYVSAAEKREKALKRIEKFKKKNVNLSPVILQNNTIASSWWVKLGIKI